MNIQIYDLYIFLDAILAGTLSIFGLAFLFLKVPKTENVKNYILTRRLLAICYFILAFFAYLEFFVGNSHGFDDFKISVFFILSVASFQAVFLSYAIVVLLNNQFFKLKNLLLELIPTSLFTFFFFRELFHPYSSPWENYLIPIFSLYFSFQVAKAIYLIHKYVKIAKKNASEYFSGQEVEYVSWIKTVGILTVLCVSIFFFTFIFPSFTLFIIIEIYAIIIFSILGIKYLNYAHEFIVLSSITTNKTNIDTQTRVNTEGLKEVLDKWIEEKHYLKSGITIVDIAQMINTNRTYLSNYINNELHLSFNLWINTLRIEEAKKLIINFPGLSFVEIAELTGYSDQSSFTRNFSKIIGSSPSAWKKKQSKFFI